MALSGSRAIAVGLVLAAGGCGGAGSTASSFDVTTPGISVATTAVGSTTSVPPSNAAATTSVAMTATSLAATSVATTMALAKPLDARAVSAALDSARVRWSDADIGSYRLTVAEDRNYWVKGCRWTTVISDGVVTESEVDPSSTCTPVAWTVDQLHETISGWLDGVDEFAGPEFGEHTLDVGFNDIGVPVAMDFDLANGNDEESSMRVTFTPIR